MWRTWGRCVMFVMCGVFLGDGALSGGIACKGW